MDGTTPQVATGRLMESGQLPLQADRTPLLVRRGMRLLTNDGSFVGFVAAVVTAVDTPAVTHLLLTRHCPHPQYQMVPVELIAVVTGLQIQLRVGQPVIDALPPWQNGGQ
ncbi:MAG: hypothetical protein KDE58_09670 [Caldilineaceae bacterium]|nr:hypothetical protein [Caldilineaceae bacterium]